MRSGWPNADTIRECPKPAASEVKHASKAADRAPTTGLVLKTNGLDKSTQRSKEQPGSTDVRSSDLLACWPDRQAEPDRPVSSRQPVPAARPVSVNRQS